LPTKAINNIKLNKSDKDKLNELANKRDWSLKKDFDKVSYSISKKVVNGLPVFDIKSLYINVTSVLYENKLFIFPQTDIKKVNSTLKVLLSLKDEDFKASYDDLGRFCR